ncbi:hypothetical protein [Parachitinimonas caeni]|uniref:Uncharacterized protein n=1 Tax=Parachitinimonas caeni TaxID=3031301 RepID=A0ABT7DS67_9NEIS|nr:hypothetical protein [Parachitinimonas caeni]MDK2122912.1 hypothetical protein [Parachitinimonas caeni]
MDWNQTANQFLDAYANQREVEGGVLFFKALQQARLDYTPESLDRLDALLDQIREKAPLSSDDFFSKIPQRNFALLITFYIGEYLARRIGQPLDWADYEQTMARQPASFKMDPGFFSYVIGYTHGALCMPLSYLARRLFLPDQMQPARDFVVSMLDVVQSQQRRDPNAWPAVMLRLFAENDYIEGNLSFRQALGRLHLDYSLQSLERLDALLKRIRAELQPDYVEFVNKPESANFVHLLAYYFAATVARHGPYPQKWLAYQQAVQMGASLPAAFETTHVCLLGHALYTPLATITSALFDDDPDNGLARQAAAILHENTDRLVIVPQPGGQSAPAGSPFPDGLIKAFEQLGWMAAFGIFMAAGGQAISPTLLRPGANDENVLVSDPFSNPDELMENYHQQLASNPHQLPFQVLIYDAYGYLPTGRTDSAILELVAYHPKPAKLTLSVPYRAANRQSGFRIHAPVLLGSSLSDEFNADIFAHIYRGIYSFQNNEFHWDNILGFNDA